MPNEIIEPAKDPNAVECMPSEMDQIMLIASALGMSEAEEEDEEEEAIEPPPVVEGAPDGKEVRVMKADPAKRLIYGVVLEPELRDSQDEIISADEIEKTAHDYLVKSRAVGLVHKTLSRSEVVESYIAPVDFTIDDGRYGKQEVKKGSWVLGVHVSDDATWGRVEKGELTGFSVGGFAEKHPG